MFHLIGLVVVLVVTVASAARLNSFHVYLPDSGDYVILARSLASFNGYRLIGAPEWPPHTLRPPGLPLLLVPAAWVAPYSAVAAKVTVLLLSAAMLIAFWKTAAAVMGSGTGLLALALLATSPFTLLFDSEVLSENPYTLLSLAVLMLLERIGRSATPSSLWILAGLLLGLTVLVRTVGITLLIPGTILLIAKGLAERRVRSDPDPSGATGTSWRAPTIALLLAWAPQTIWMVRNMTLDSPGSYWRNLAPPEGQSLLARFLDVPAQNIPYYVAGLAQIAAPAVWPDPTSVGLSALVWPPLLPVQWAVVAGAVLLGLALVGMWTRRTMGDLLRSAYALLYLAVLASYTFKNVRFLWPLWPILLIYVLAGSRVLVCSLTGALRRAPSARARAALPPPGGIGRSAAVALAVIAAGALASQAWISGRMIHTNLWRALYPDEFYSRPNDFPLLYYADLPRAGRWLRDHTPPGARILSGDSGLYCHSRRQQRFAFLQMLNGSLLYDEVRGTQAQYVVVTQYGDLPADDIHRDGPSLRWEEVYSERMVRIYRVRPNLDGTVAPDPPESRGQILALEAKLLAVSPETDRALLLMSILSVGGGSDLAVKIGLEAIRAGTRSIDLYLTVANALLWVGRYGDAIVYAERARDLQDADFNRANIDGALRAAEAFRRRSNEHLPGEERARAGLDLAEGHLSMHRFRAAWDEVERAYHVAPELPAVQFLRGTLLDWFGRSEEAGWMFERAAAGAHKEASRYWTTVQWAHALRAGQRVTLVHAGGKLLVDPGNLEDYERLAEVWASYSLPGRAIETLRLAAGRFPDQASPYYRLGGMYADFGRWDEAIQALQRAAQLEPRDLEVRRRLQRTLDSSQPPLPP